MRDIWFYHKHLSFYKQHLKHKTVWTVGIRAFGLMVETGTLTNPWEVFVTNGWPIMERRFMLWLRIPFLNKSGAKKVVLWRQRAK